MVALGVRVYGLGAVVLGVVEMAFGAFSPDWLPVPTNLPGYHFLAYASAAVLIVAGVAVNAPRLAAIAALMLAALFASGMLLFEAAHTLAKPMDWGGWQAVAESTAMALGGVLIYAQTSRGSANRAATIARFSRRLFGLCLLVFGGSHFVFAKLTASLVPAWLPPSQLFWAYITGVAQIAAGLSLLSGIRARAAAILLTVMYLVFGVLVHVPSVLAKPLSQDNWTENAINLILVGVAWSVSDSLSRAVRKGHQVSA